MPEQVVASEFMTMEGRKFSSSRGIVIYVKDILARYPVDAVRYYISVAGPETSDADFTWSEFVPPQQRGAGRQLGATWSTAWPTSCIRTSARSRRWTNRR